MLIVHFILAALAVGALALRPRGSAGVALVAVAAAIDACLGAPVGPALAVVAPLLVFLSAALTLARFVERAGLADRLAGALAQRAAGSALRLYALVCGVCALLTAAVSLDGAVVLMVPLLVQLHRRFAAPFAPLFIGSVVVANVVSIAVPQGNPTNLVIIDRLGLSSSAFVAHMLLPGVAAAILCALGVALVERRALADPVGLTSQPRGGFTGEEVRAGAAVALAAAAAWSAPLYGIAPWWPFAGAVAFALLAARELGHVTVPWRIVVQVGGLLIATEALGLTLRASAAGGLPELFGIAGAVGLAAAVANNLPVSVCVTGLLTGGAPAYAASVGLAVGSIATAQGSVATLIASELAGERAPRLTVARLAPLAVAGVVVAILLLWLML